jgi:glycosyltransferase involved in cell wall biosynthesis
MGRRGRRLIASHYGWQSVGAAFLDLYEATLRSEAQP